MVLNTKRSIQQLEYQASHYEQHLKRMKEYHLRRDKVYLKDKKQKWYILNQELIRQRQILI